MKSFKDYTRRAAEVAEAMEENNGQQTSQTQSEQTSQAVNAEELTRKIAATYHGSGNANMLQAILEEAEKSKRAGTLSNAEIENFYQSFAPMLNGFQRKKLREVVDKLKQIE